MTDEKPTVKQTKIMVDYQPGRNAKIFHLYDSTDKEIVLSETEARRVAKNILRISKGEV
jgi:hypothetical protein